MSRDALQVGEISKPRFEFRSFGQEFDVAHHRMARLSMPVPEDVWERTSDETYVLSRATDADNTKIRAGTLDLKHLLHVVEGLEQWMPRVKTSFPVSAEVLRQDLFPAFQVEPPDLPLPEYGLGAFLDLVGRHRDLQAVRVHKQRFGYMVNGAICEYAVVLINGARVVTVGVESTDPWAVRQTMTDCRLNGIENINYLQAIKRVVGMASGSLANE